VPARHRRSSAPSGARRRKLVWSTLDQSVTLIAGANTTVNMLSALAVAGSSLTGITIMRTHLTLAPTTALTLADSIRVGLIVCRSSDIGAGSILTAADPELDWMLLRREYVTSSGLGSGGGDVLAYDVKAKRKMEELNQAYGLCITNAAGGSKTIGLFARTLVALP